MSDAKPRTLFDKVWDSHVVDRTEDGTCVLYIDRHLVHEVTSPQAFEGLRNAGRKVRRLNGPVAAVDDQQLGADARDCAQSVADLLGPLDLIVEDIRMVGAIVADARELRDVPRRLGVGEQSDAGARHQGRTRLSDRKLRRVFSMNSVFCPL